jgi:hypothetical protein
VMSYATCRGTRTRGVGEVVDDEPARGEVVDDEPVRGEVVDDESRDKTRNVPKQPDARRRKIDSALTGARRLAQWISASRRVD